MADRSVDSSRTHPLFVFRADQPQESHPHRGWGVRPCAQIWCRGGAVSGVHCRPMCCDMSLCAAICGSVERKLLVFLGFIFSSQAEGRRFEPGLALQQTTFQHFLSTSGSDASVRGELVGAHCASLPYMSKKDSWQHISITKYGFRKNLTFPPRAGFMEQISGPTAPTVSSLAPSKLRTRGGAPCRTQESAVPS